jgi:hypothetical protein
MVLLPGIRMMNKTIKEAVIEVFNELNKMTPQELRAELNKHQNGELANALNEASAFINSIHYRSPIQYLPNFFPDHSLLFTTLWEELDWLDVAGPRLEYYVNDVDVPYTYGQGTGVRTYLPQKEHPCITSIRTRLEEYTNSKFEVCFLNGYRDGKDQLGWHSDNSPEMDDDRPIAIVSLGARREIYFRKNPSDIEDAVEKLWLESGSLCLMTPGMQDTHQHRIPKASYICGPRISLTFRGYVK